MNPSIATFAELLAEARKGPYHVNCDQSINHGDVEDYTSIVHTSYEKCESTPVELELICRLLNFAHAGGIDVFLGAVSSIEEDQEFTLAQTAVIRSLKDILNGQPQHTPHENQ